MDVAEYKNKLKDLEARQDEIDRTVKFLDQFEEDVANESNRASNWAEECGMMAKGIPGMEKAFFGLQEEQASILAQTDGMLSDARLEVDKQQKALTAQRQELETQFKQDQKAQQAPSQPKTGEVVK